MSCYRSFALSSDSFGPNQSRNTDWEDPWSNTEWTLLFFFFFPPLTLACILVNRQMLAKTSENICFLDYEDF